MQVGTIVKLKVELLGNPVGTLGVCYEEYGRKLQTEDGDMKGRSFIFDSGNYDGFSEQEQKDLLTDIGFEVSYSAYQFENVIKLSDDFRRGFWNFQYLSEKYSPDPMVIAEATAKRDEMEKRWARLTEGQRDTIRKKFTSAIVKEMKLQTVKYNQWLSAEIVVGLENEQNEKEIGEKFFVKVVMFYNITPPPALEMETKMQMNMMEVHFITSDQFLDQVNKNRVDAKENGLTIEESLENKTEEEGGESKE